MLDQVVKVTDDRLAVARAVRDHLIVRIDRDERELLRRLNFEQIIESLPEPTPLPAPTGPGWWWARGTHDEGIEWVAVEVVEREVRHERGDYPALRVLLPGTEEDALTEDFDAWVGPLQPPAEVQPHSGGET